MRKKPKKKERNEGRSKGIKGMESKLSGQGKAEQRGKEGEIKGGSRREGRR